MLPDFTADRSYDRRDRRCGPAGLAAAVYATSEGLSVLVIDSRSFGGQAGASARIENYLGFPNRHHRHGAHRPGVYPSAEIWRSHGNSCRSADPQVRKPKHHRLARRTTSTTSFGSRRSSCNSMTISACAQTTVVIASGGALPTAKPRASRCVEGRGVHFWASPIEARLCTSQEVVLVGGGNSAGQATVFLASYKPRKCIC